MMVAHLIDEGRLHCTNAVAAALRGVAHRATPCDARLIVRILGVYPPLAQWVGRAHLFGRSGNGADAARDR
jgi:hypothetical protein